MSACVGSREKGWSLENVLESEGALQEDRQRKETVGLYLDGGFSPYWQVFGVSEWIVYLCTQALGGCFVQVAERERVDEGRERGMKKINHVNIIGVSPTNLPTTSDHGHADEEL